MPNRLYLFPNANCPTCRGRGYYHTWPLQGGVFVYDAEHPSPGEVKLCGCVGLTVQVINRAGGGEIVIILGDGNNADTIARGLRAGTKDDFNASQR